MHTEIPVVETDRLRLRGRTVDDFPFLRDMWADPDVTRFVSGEPQSEEVTWSKYLRAVGHWTALGYGYWIIEEKASGNLMGEVGFCEFKREMERPIVGQPEIGWALAASAHGFGFATEATMAAIAWGEKNFDSDIMSCIISPGNKASIKVAEKCGFMLDERQLYHGEQVFVFRRHRGSN